MLTVNRNCERPLIINSKKKKTTGFLTYNGYKLRNVNTSGLDNNNNDNNNNNIHTSKHRTRKKCSISDYIMTWSNNRIPASKMAIF